jgi:hypothetical protein
MPHLLLQGLQLLLVCLNLLLVRPPLRAEGQQHVCHLRLQEGAQQPTLQGFKPWPLLAPRAPGRHTGSANSRISRFVCGRGLLCCKAACHLYHVQLLLRRRGLGHDWAAAVRERPLFRWDGHALYRVRHVSVPCCFRAVAHWHHLAELH